MAVGFSNTNKPINPRGNDASPKGYNRAALYSGKALDFDGVNDYVDLDGFTMAGNVATIVFYGKFSNDGRILDLNPNRFIIENTASSGLRVYNNTSYTSYGTTDRDKVGFYAIVSDGTTQRAYYNGHQLGSDETVTALDWDSVTNMKLGSYFGGGSVFLDGQLSGFKIFNTALTADQVDDLYNNPEKVVPTGVADSALKLWLPMQEGAGTTAYDGSGNGNHGTISGASYVHAIGSPVAQTAVIDWNKGSNLVPYSEELDEWTASALSVVQSSATAPDGSTNAYTLTDNSFSSYGICFPSSTISMSGDYVASVFIKKTTGSITNYPGLDIAQRGTYLIIDTTNGTSVESGSGSNYTDVTITSYNDDWWRVSAKLNYSNTARPMRLWPAISSNGTSISASATGSATFWGAQVEAADSLGAYIPNHTGTAITSDVLLPQGLTTGRDITGVNLFENVRKQGALNLDGNSWAEVHDNESLDFGTGSFSLEAWARVKYVNQGSAVNAILTLGGDSASNEAIYINSSPAVKFEYNGDTTGTGTETEGDWVHIVGTYDETNATLYLNGSQNAQNARTAADVTNTLVKQIGRDSTTFRYYNDQIAQPRIYNRALTASEVLQNYNSGKSIYTNS